MELGRLRRWPRHRWLARLTYTLSRAHNVARALLWMTGLRRRGRRNAMALTVRHVRMVLPSLPETLEGFRILHISDLHLDAMPSLGLQIADLLEGLPVDLCVMTGDYRFGFLGSQNETLSDEMPAVISAIQSRHGIIGILGNHDFARDAEELRRMGVKMLLNEATEIRCGPASLWVAGLDDPHFYGCDDLPGALATVPEGAFKILLVHSPELIAEAQQAGVSLYLCGHTHGGQIRLPFIGPVITNAHCHRRFTRGAWEFKGMRGHTSPGLGVATVPARFLCPPEATVMTLHGR